jgi:phosphatidylglycerophosphatase A
VTAGRSSAATRVAMALATCGYIGYIPIAPGTFGSAAGLLLYLVLNRMPPVVTVVAILVLFAVGVWSGSIAERELGGTDPGPVVLDEVIGMLITLAFVPVNLTGVFVAFIVFRAMDVVKPWPSRSFEALHGGLGIMADDAMAAVYGNLCMRGLLIIAPMGWLR